MGRFRVVFASPVLLSAQIRVEDMGKRPYPHARSRTQLPVDRLAKQRHAIEATDRLLRHEPAHAQPVRGPVFPLRDLQLFKRRCANIHRRLLPGGRVQHVRIQCVTVHGHEAGRQNGSNGARVPKGGEMHVSQVRPVRYHTKIRRPLHVAAEHCQRKDLRADVVLVFVRRLHQFSQHVVPRRCYPDTEFPLLIADNEIAFGQQKRRQKHFQQVPGGRLVRVVPVEQEHRTVDFQGAHNRLGYDVEP